MEIRDAVTLITGASSGIGRDLAVHMAQNGARTVLLARRQEQLDAARDECVRYAPSLAIRCDVRERQQVEAAVDLARDTFGAVDILVNNAGYSRWTLARDARVEDFEDIMRTNYLGMVYATKAVLPTLLERRRGRIVNIASIAGEVGVAHHSHYCASKFAVVGFTECLWYELRGTGVGVTLVKPGVVDTPLFDHESFVDFPAANRTRMIPVRRVSEAIVRAIQRDRFEVTVPPYFALGPILRHLWPGLFRLVMRRSQS